MGRNTTGPPCSIDLLAAGSITDSDRHQQAKECWLIRRASNEWQVEATENLLEFC